MAIGMSAMRAPQSGVTSRAIRSRMAFQIWSIGSVGSCRSAVAAGQPRGDPAARA